MAEPDQGWAYPPARNPKAHYFNAEKVSLCGAWSSEGLAFFEPLSEALGVSVVDCKSCRRKLETRGVKT
jgi:hypothetical protein